MASWTNIKALRLTIHDPDEVIDLVSVANEDAREAIDEPAPQTAYQQADNGTYWIYDDELSAWARLDLELSDATVGALLNSYTTVPRAAAEAVGIIVAALGRRLGIASHKSGAEETELVNLTTAYNFYKAIREALLEKDARDEGKSGGGMFRTRRPHIAGGMEC